MRNFDKYKEVMSQQNITSSHECPIAPVINDRIEDGDILTIEKNITFFTQEYRGHKIVFVVLPNQHGELKRMYITRLNTSIGTVHDMLEHFPSFESFFKEMQGHKFSVASERAEQEGFGIPVSKYILNWC